MKACFFDYLMDEDGYKILPEKSLATSLESEIIDPLRKKDIDIDHKPESDIYTFNQSYDRIIIHSRSIHPKLEKLLVEEISKPTLIVSGTYAKLNAFKKNFGEYKHIGYSMIHSIKNLLSFLNNNQS